MATFAPPLECRKHSCVAQISEQNPPLFMLLCKIKQVNAKLQSRPDFLSCGSQWVVKLTEGAGGPDGWSVPCDPTHRSKKCIIISYKHLI